MRMDILMIINACLRIGHKKHKDFQLLLALKILKCGILTWMSDDNWKIFHSLCQDLKIADKNGRMLEVVQRHLIHWGLLVQWEAELSNRYLQNELKRSLRSNGRFSAAVGGVEMTYGTMCCISQFPWEMLSDGPEAWSSTCWGTLGCCWDKSCSNRWTIASIREEESSIRTSWDGRCCGRDCGSSSELHNSGSGFLIRKPLLIRIWTPLITKKVAKLGLKRIV